MMKTPSKPLYTTKDHLLFQLWLKHGKCMKMVSSMDVIILQTSISITESNVLDGEMMVHKTIGLLETLGELIGEPMDTSI